MQHGSSYLHVLQELYAAPLPGYSCAVHSLRRGTMRVAPLLGLPLPSGCPHGKICVATRQNKNLHACRCKTLLAAPESLATIADMYIHCIYAAGNPCLSTHTLALLASCLPGAPLLSPGDFSLGTCPLSISLYAERLRYWFSRGFSLHCNPCQQSWPQAGPVHSEQLRVVPLMPELDGKRLTSSCHMLHVCTESPSPQRRR